MIDNEHTLTIVSTPEDWEVYHNIRLKELFEAKGRIGIYDANRPEERASSNFPLLLKLGGQGIGTTRLDVRTNDTAIIRLVAIINTKQSVGHGRVLADMVENLARGKGVKKLLVNADKMLSVTMRSLAMYGKTGTRPNWLVFPSTRYKCPRGLNN